ncbi:ATP-dependent DNA helicase [Trichonephila clavipes]|nr:ATP-dependent DNA helicase [Trichonephila clavipes]
MSQLGCVARQEKVQLPEIETPPEPLNGLLIGTDPDSNVFLKSIRRFNSCFQMTSFGATEIIRNTNANGQNSILHSNQRPSLSLKWAHCCNAKRTTHKYLQIYFYGRRGSSGSALANRVNARCDYNNLDSLYARRIVRRARCSFERAQRVVEKYSNHICTNYKR